MPLFNLDNCLSGLRTGISDTLDLSVFRKMSDWQEQYAPLGYMKDATYFALLPTGEVITGAYDNRTLTMNVWNPLTGERLRTFRDPSTSIRGIHCLVALPTGQVLAVVTITKWHINDNKTSWKVRMWDPLTGERLMGMKKSLSLTRVKSLAVLPTGAIISLEDNDGPLSVWNPLTGKYLGTLRGVYSFVVLLTGEVVAAGAAGGGTLKVWNPMNNNLRTLAVSQGCVKLAVLPTGEVVSCGDTLKVWNPLTGECLRTLMAGTSPIYNLAVLATGEVISGTESERHKDYAMAVKVWNPLTGECLRTLEVGEYSGQDGFRVWPTGELVVGGSYNTPRRVWLPPHECSLTYDDLAPVFNELIHSSGRLQHLSLAGTDLRNPSAYAHLLRVIEANPQLQTLVVDHTGLTLAQLQNVAEKKQSVRQKVPPLPMKASPPVEVPQDYMGQITSQIMHMTLDAHTYEGSEMVHFLTGLQQQTLQAIKACNEKEVLACIAQDQCLLTGSLQGGFLISHMLKRQEPSLLKAIAAILTPAHWATLLQQQPIEAWLEGIVNLHVTSQERKISLLTTFLEAVEKAYNSTYPAKQLIEIGFKHHSRVFLKVGFSRLGSVNCPLDEVGNTALHCAVAKSDNVLVQFLLELGADYSVKNNAGQKPRDIARALGCIPIFNQLTDAKIMPTLQRLGIFDQFRQFQQFLQEQNNRNASSGALSQTPGSKEGSNFYSNP